MAVMDVARYILEQRGEMAAMKLQKLVYYSQCWALVWDEEPLFDEEIQAWMNGPVCKPLYDVNKGKFKITADDIADGDSNRLNEDEKETIDVVLKDYGDKTAQWLSDLTHLEEPWNRARRRCGAQPGEKCNEVITLADMHEYYSGIQKLEDEE
ncbi:MAG: SocA family protein [Gammaproteobacteria bacterium AqS3]|nr:SocA family protein [Gammaproteobacteria bacterium AqS3]